MMENKLCTAIQRELVRVVRTGRLGGRASPYASRFERVFTRRLGVSHAVSMNSGTSALHAALVGVGVKPGDEVLVPTLSVSCVGQAVLHAGAGPVFVDVDPLTWNMDPADAEGKMTKKTKAMVVVHLFGVPCQMESLMWLAKRHRLKMVDDAAQALGARYRGWYAGTFGDAGIFSFEQVKHLNTGEGGMVVTRHAAIADRVRAFAHFQPGPQTPLAFNYRMTAFQAAAGLAQLPWLKELVASRVRRALEYRWKLERWHEVVPQTVMSEAEPAYFCFGVTVPGYSRAVAERLLRARGWRPRPWFPPLHRDPVFRHVARQAVCPMADRLSETLFTLPTA